MIIHMSEEKLDAELWIDKNLTAMLYHINKYQ